MLFLVTLAAAPCRRRCGWSLRLGIRREEQRRVLTKALHESSHICVGLRLAIQRHSHRDVFEDIGEHPEEPLLLLLSALMDGDKGIL